MAATQGQQIQDRCHHDVVWHSFLGRPDREAGAKTCGSAAKLASQEPAY
jgi:hypothetical protein